MSLVYTHRATKDLKTLGPMIKPRVLEGLKNIAADPYVGKKLKGPLRHLHSLRVGEYRIIYQVERPKSVIVMTIVPRGNAYKD